MDDTDSQKDTKPARNSIDNFILTAINVAAVGAGIAAAISANKNAGREAQPISAVEIRQPLEKALAELNAKVDKLSDQLAELRQAREPQPAAAEASKDLPAKNEGSGKDQQQKAEVIYVRKSSEFWFYN